MVSTGHQAESGWPGKQTLDNDTSRWYNDLMTNDGNLPAHALDVQMDLLRYYTRTSQGQMYADSVTEMTFGEGKVYDGMGVMLHERILIGETYAVSEEIVDVLEFAAATIPTFRIEESDLPSRSGFVYLERAIVIPDVRGNPLVVKAFGWTCATVSKEEPLMDETLKEINEQSPAMAMALSMMKAEGRLDGHALAVMLWTDPTDPRDQMYEEIERDFKDRDDFDMWGRPSVPLLSLVSGVWPVSEDLPETWTETHPSSLNFGKFVLGFLRFIEEPWVEYRQFVPGRHLRKRFHRARKVEPSIHVVQLRRALTRGTAKRGDGESQTEYTHRWLVRGHWRNQACGPGRSLRRPRWITEHIAGPEDKPLIVHDKIFSVDR